MGRGALAGTAILAAAIAVDALLGEPPAAIHPVVWMGRAVRLAERWAPREGRAAQLAAGAIIAIAIPAAFAAGAWALLRAAAPVPVLEIVLAAFLLKSSFAARALGAAAARVRAALGRGAIDEARVALGRLCSRDASRLGPEEVAAGAVESIAENLSDSFVAPVLFYVAGGVPGAILYRAVNTLDAMIGYHGRYEYLGKTSARLDDLLNLVPARLTALLLLAAGAATGADGRRGWRVLRRDGARTESPNAGRPMAAMAGLLGVVLEKPGHYRLGGPGALPRAETIASAWRIAGAAAVAAAAGALAAVAAIGR